MSDVVRKHCEIKDGRVVSVNGEWAGEGDPPPEHTEFGGDEGVPERCPTVQEFEEKMSGWKFVGVAGTTTHYTMFLELNTE